MSEKIVVDSDGVIVMSVDGILTCTNQEVLNRIRKHSRYGTMVRLYQPFGETVAANVDDYTGNKICFVAAMMAANPGRSIILEAPADVMSWLEKDQEENGESQQNRWSYE